MRKPKAKTIVKGFTLLLFLVAAIGIYVSLHAAKNKVYIMEGQSMEPTIRAGETIKAKVVPASEIKRGDVIVFKSPVAANGRQVKRVVGLPADRVTISNGELTVLKPDGHPYTPYEDKNTLGLTDTIVEPNHFYVVGDNRAHSIDSRNQAFGQVPFDALLSVVIEE